MTEPAGGEVVLELGAVPVLPVSVPTGQSGKVLGSGALLYGWSLRETTGAAIAQLDVYDGADQTGQLVATVVVPAGGSVAAYLAGIGVLCRRGVYVHASAGSVAGVLWAAGL